MDIQSFVSLIDYYYVKIIVLFLILFIIGFIVMFIVCSYFLIKVLRVGIDDNNILFYKYNKTSKKILDLYGDYELTKLYLVRQPFTKFTTFLLNIITFCNYDRLIKESQNSFPNHVKLVFEIKLKNNCKKLLLLEKTNSINISENFHINDLQEMKQINVGNKKKDKLTIKSILQQTQDRVGAEKFFNWHIYNNNCKEFIKEILITINKYNKNYDNFIFGDISMDKLMNVIIPTELAIHIVNSFVNINNIFEKYILDNGLFC